MTSATAPGSRTPRVAVVGAGAVGGYYGAMLAAAGVAVTMLARPMQVEVLRARGLRLSRGGRERDIVVEASADPSSIAGADVVLVCVKSGDTEAAARALAPFVRPAMAICCLQNGIDNAPRLEAALGLRAWPVPVYMAAESVAPGHVRHLGGGELVMADDAELDRVATLFERAGVSVRRSANVTGELWRKLALNCAYNALSAVTGMPYGELVLQAGVPRVMHDSVVECVNVARAAGIALEGDVFEGVDRIARTMPGQFSSTAQDLRRGRPTEIDDLNGAIVRRGEALGIDTPVNRTLHALVKAMEARAAGAALSGSTAATAPADRP
jgi:2-dehydropantoate 2-reductase